MSDRATQPANRDQTENPTQTANRNQDKRMLATAEPSPRPSHTDRREATAPTQPRQRHLLILSDFEHQAK